MRHTTSVWVQCDRLGVAAPGKVIADDDMSRLVIGPALVSRGHAGASFLNLRYLANRALSCVAQATAGR